MLQFSTNHPSGTDDSLGLGLDSLGLGLDSLGWGLDSLGWGLDSLGLGLDSLGIGLDSLGLGLDSLGLGLDSLGLEIEPLYWGLDPLGSVEFFWSSVSSVQFNFISSNPGIYTLISFLICSLFNIVISKLEKYIISLFVSFLSSKKKLKWNYCFHQNKKWL